MNTSIHSPPTHHPDAGHLIDYAAGTLAEPVALLVACHMTFCPLCREEVARMEAVGGALFETVDPQPVSIDVRDKLFAALETTPATEEPSVAVEPVVAEDGPLPLPLAAVIGKPLDQVKYRKFGAVREFLLDKREDHYRSKLMSIEPGAVMAQHTHEGEELSLVLSGGFTDGDKHFVRGDVATAGPEQNHSPVADDDGECLLLAVLDAPLKLTGTFGRLLNPFLKY